MTTEEIFEEFRKLYPGSKRGFDAEYSNFKKKYSKNFHILVLELKPNLIRQHQEKQQQAKAGDFVANWKNLQTYINQQAWTEEFTVQKLNLLNDGNTKISGGKQSSSDKAASRTNMVELARAILQNGNGGTQF